MPRPGTVRHGLSARGDESLDILEVRQTAAGQALSRGSREVLVLLAGRQAGSDDDEVGAAAGGDGREGLGGVRVALEVLDCELGVLGARAGVDGPRRAHEHAGGGL